MYVKKYITHLCKNDQVLHSILRYLIKYQYFALYTVNIYI